jgi:hypothetical protein
MVLLTSALLLSVSSVLVPTPVHAQVVWDTPPLITGPPGTFVSFAGHSLLAVTGCSLSATYTKFFSPSLTPVCNVAGDGTAVGSITGFFKVRAPSEISAANPLPGQTFFYSWTVSTNVPTEFITQIFTVTQSIAFSLSSAGPWTFAPPFVVMETQPLYIHGWGFDPASTSCTYLGDPPGDTQLPCSVASGEMAGGIIPPVGSAAGSPWTVIITGNSLNGDTASLTASVVTGPTIIASPDHGSKGLQVTIFGTGFSSLDSTTNCAVSITSTAPPGGGALYDSTPTCTMTTVGGWNQPLALFTVSAAATIATAYTLRITGSTGDYADTSIPFTARNSPTLVLSPGPYTAGTIVTVTTPAPPLFSAIDVGACSSLLSGPGGLIGSSSCAIDGTGHLVGTFFIISNTAAGQLYTITVTGSKGDYGSTTLTPAASVKLNPTSGVPPVTGPRPAPGTEVTVSGSGFSLGDSGCTIDVFPAPPAPYNLVIDQTGEPACTVTSGVLTAKFKVGAASTYGIHFNVRVTGTGGDSATAFFNVNPTIVLSQSYGPAGLAVSISGSGFDPTVPPPLAACSTYISNPAGLAAPGALCTRNPDGTITASFTVAAAAANGNYTVTVTGANVVVPPDTATALFSKTASMTLLPPSGRPGTPVLISGTGFAAGDTGCSFVIAYPTTPNLISNPLCTIAGGAMSGSFTVASGAAGSYLVKVVGTTGDYGLAPFNVPSAATLELDPISGQVGQVVSASGPNYLGTHCLLTASPSGLFTSQSCIIVAGNLTGGFTVAPTAAPGTLYVITAQTDAGPLDAATANFAVVSGTIGNIALNPISGPVGQVVSGKAAGFSTDVSCIVISIPSDILSSPSCIISGGNATVGFSVKSGAVPGSYIIMALGNTGKSATGTFTVTAPGLFSLSVNPSSLILSPGGTATATVTVLSSGTFNSPVTLSASFPADVAGGFSPNPVTPTMGGTVLSTFSIGISNAAPSTTTTIPITGTGGGLTASTSISLVIQVTVTTMQTSTAVTSSVISTTSATVTGPWVPPSCVIATATFGSEVSPAVQFLRNFRDKLVLSTTAGSAFMQVFNAWYYSFSPSVAQFIASNDPIRAPIRVMLYPLLGILGISALVYSWLAWAPEFGVLMAGLVASSLIGLTYFTAPALIGMQALLRKRRISIKILGKASLASLAIALTLLTIGEVAGSFLILAIASSAVVLTCVIAVPTIAAFAMLHPNRK